MGESISNVGEKSLYFSRKMSTISELPSEDRLNNVRSAFSGVREIIAKADSIIDADQYAYVGGGILTLIFGTVWYWDPSFLPFILSNEWNEEKEKKYDEFCRNLSGSWAMQKE